MSESNFNARRIGEILEPAWSMAMDPPRGIKFPWWSKLSEYMGGMRPNELTILCAPTGAGKTEFLSNIAAQNIQTDTSQFLAPVETGDLDFVNRISGTLFRTPLNSGDPVPLPVIRRGSELHGDMLSKARTYVATYRNRVTPQQMCTTLEGWYNMEKIQVAVLDNINFMLEVTRASDQVIEMDRAVHEFVLLAQRLPIHTILVMHPKKTDGGRVESEFDIKGSSTAVQEADNVLLFNRPKPDDVKNGIHEWGDRELVFKKLRKRGGYVNKPIWMRFESQRYMEIVENENVGRPTFNKR